VLAAVLALVGIFGGASTSDAERARASLRIDSPDQLPAARKLSLGVHNGMIVELPVDIKNVAVSDPELLDAAIFSARRVYLVAKKPGNANVIFLGREGRKELVLELLLERDVTGLSDTLRKLLPGSAIKVSAVGEGVVLSGTVVNPADAVRAGDIATEALGSGKGKVVNMIGGGRSQEQVLLKVTVAEMQREALRRLGVNVPEALARAGNITFGKVVENAFPITGPGTAAAIATATGVPSAVAGSALQAGWSSGNHRVTAIIQSLERTGLTRILAEPNLTAISGETAKFLAGGEFPIPVAMQNNTIAVSFKQFGISLGFTPFVLGEGRISLKVSAEVSEIAPENSVVTDRISIPGLRVRRAETSVELPSGGALAMAGLISDETRQSAEGIPGLKTLPILGALFRSRDFKRNETELVFIVTPYTVSPTERRDLARPDDGFAPPSELQSIFRGLLHRTYGRAAQASTSRLRGDYGFAVEYPDVGGLK
jgi:pilus assembly protein CpaC